MQIEKWKQRTEAQFMYDLKICYLKNSYIYLRIEGVTDRGLFI